MNLHCVLIWFGCVFVGVYTYNAPRSILSEQLSWRFLQYQYDSVEEEADAIQSGTYNFRKNFPVDVEVVPDGRIFISILRDHGAPASLATIVNRTGDGGGPLLRPYPDWYSTNTSDCGNVVAVYRMAQDECNRLWVLDTGKVGDNRICAPKLLAFDLSTNKLVQRINIPMELATNANGEGLLVTLVIDTVGADCGQINIYMADIYGSGLVIWNGQSMWRIESSYFKPDPSAQNFSVHGTDFQYVRGLFALSMTREEQNVQDRLLYFRPLSSYDMYYAKAEEFHSKKNDQSSIKYFTEPNKLPSQSVAQTFSSKGILFFSGTTELSILCWNRHKPFTRKNIVTVVQDEKTLQWASAIKVYPGDPSETLWVLTNRWQEYYTNKINFNETNFRVLAGSVDDLVRGTNCE